MKNKLKLSFYITKFSRIIGIDEHITSNLIVNYLSKLWSIVSIYLFVPLYIKYLGISAYGVIAFHSVLLGIIFIADAGLSSAFAREVATNSRSNIELATLLRSLEKVYIAIVLLIVCGVFLASGWITHNWLKPSQEIPAPLLQICIVMMGMIAAIQVAMSLYNGGLMGAEHQAMANGFQIALSMFRSGFVILPLYLFPNLLTYFCWQLVTCICFLIWMRNTVWLKLNLNTSVKYSTKALKNIGKFALGMFGIAVISALNTQLDKLVLSKMLNLQELARYTVAGMLSQTPSIMTLPIAVSLLPRLTRWTSDGQRARLIMTYHQFSYVITSIAVTAGFVIALNPTELITWWTGNQMIGSGLQLTVRILVLGHVMLALQFMPYHLALANGHSRTNLIIGLVFLVVTPFLLVVLIRRIGIPGAAIPWLLMNASGAILLTILLTRRFLIGQLKQYFFIGIFVPVSIISACVASTQWAWNILGLSPGTWIWKNLIVAITSCISCSAIYLLVLKKPSITKTNSIVS